MKSLHTLTNWSILSPVHRVEVLVGLVHAVPRLVVIKMVEVDASLGGDISESLSLFVVLNKSLVFRFISILVLGFLD